MKVITCDRCLYVAEFYLRVVRQIGTEEPTDELWCLSCVRGDSDDE